MKLSRYAIRMTALAFGVVALLGLLCMGLLWLLVHGMPFWVLMIPGGVLLVWSTYRDFEKLDPDRTRK